jgi:hypothetical protein
MPGVRVLFPFPIRRPAGRTFQRLFVLPDECDVPVFRSPDGFAFGDYSS